MEIRPSARSTDFLGLDTETIDGYARLIGLSDGRAFRLNSLAGVADFFSHFLTARKTYFFAWNADYDIQALLKYFPKNYLTLLLKGVPVLMKFKPRKDEDFEPVDINIRYVKGKYLQFDHNYIFDAYQYYGTSLKAAAKKYLPEGEGKLDFDAAMITEGNIDTPEVTEYCLRDALIAHKLYNLFFAALPDKLKGTKPISNAFYSWVFFRNELNANKPKKAANDYFRNAYHGGRFEIYERGAFGKLYVYDINSAYPFEISQLRTLAGATYVNDPRYDPDATYSIYKIRVDIKDKFVSPLLWKNKTLCCFPVGNYEGYVTKGEFEAVKEWRPEILEGYHIHTGREKPFEAKIAELYHARKTSGFPLPYKIILNSLYGKTGASVEKWIKAEDIGEDIPVIDYMEKDGTAYVKYEDIAKSNFIYASEITARTRLRLYELVKKYPSKVVMVNTDSVVSKVPLDLPLSDRLGDWKREVWDEAYVIGSGVYFYRIGGVWYGKYRGFPFKESVVKDILGRIFQTRTAYVSFNVKKRYSIQEAWRVHDEELGNIIREVSRKLNLNFDQKRIWRGVWKRGRDLKTVRIKSLALYLDKNLLSD
jgi:hypothetical protein